MKSIIQKVVVSLLILGLLGCGIDSLVSYEMAKKTAGTDYVVRVISESNFDVYVIIDKKGNVREIKYYANMKFHTPNVAWDEVLFHIEDLNKTKITIVKNELDK